MINHDTVQHLVVVLLLLLLALLAVVPPTMPLAFSPRRLLVKYHTRRQNRYFTQESLLPPLQRVVVANVQRHQHNTNNNNNNTMITSSSSSSSSSTTDYTRSIPVMYTNDPASVARWLEENVPSHGCTLGFDVEVRAIVRFSFNISFVCRQSYCCALLLLLFKQRISLEESNC